MMSTLKNARLKKARIQSRLSKRRNVVWENGYWVSLLLVGGMWMTVVFLLYMVEDLGHTPLIEGQRAPATVIAEVDFEALDLAATELARRQEEGAVLPVFAINTTALQSSLRTIDLLFNRLVELRSEPEPEPAGEDAASEPDDTAFPEADIARLAPAGQEETVRNAIKDALTALWPLGIISTSEKDSRFHGVAAAGRISIATGEAEPYTLAVIDHLNTPEAATYTLVNRIIEDVRPIPLSWEVIHRAVREVVQPNLIYDAARTEAARLQAQARVETMTKQVRAGTTLINQGDRVTPQQLEDWRAHSRRLNELQSSHDHLLQWIGRSLLLMLALVICSGLLQIVRPDIVRSPSRILLLVILSLLSLLSVAGMLYLANSTAWISSSVVEYTLLLAFAPILATILIGPATAVVVGVWTSFTAAVMFNNSFLIFAMGLLVTIIVAHMARNVRARSRMIRIGLWVGLAQVLYGLSLAVLTQLPPQMILWQALAALLSGLLAALLALLFLPVFESLFDITTDITLLELSDMGHPLLQRLALEAPGTYHHSLMVANLAQSAALEVGANALLVRVCAYFHDIGKLTKPEFFVENTQFRENPHDDLAPSMSTLVIISHVKEGIGMARRAKLPAPIIDAIEQHHGTGLVAYFYHRARTQLEETGNGGNAAAREISETDFRYPGPCPQTVEMGILLLADSVEAASRSMEKPTPSRIENLVHDIVDARMQDDQLDDCDLTFAQLKAIKRSFIFTLTNMLHGRVPYPKDENRNQQPTESAPPLTEGTDQLRPLGNGAGANA
jgi:cyclic-di-AMP phosphodiesterase PgpH